MWINGIIYIIRSQGMQYLKGDYDKYAESTKKKKGTTLVDDEFLSEIETWRELLAKEIALRNTELNC